MPPSPPTNISWTGTVPGTLVLLDQTRLPHSQAYLECSEPESLRRAILNLSVRGAPAIGVAAAYGTVLCAQVLLELGQDEFHRRLTEELDLLAATRPTAVNLSWAVERARQVIAASPDLPPPALAAELLTLARSIHDQEKETCRRIGEEGLTLLPDPATILTHCNAGHLATGGTGTALAMIYAAHAAGRQVRVYADETRPLWQGIRLTAWELEQAGIPVTVICDGAAGALLASDRIDAVVVGADRVAANGDFANKIGTYPLAVLAARHGVPFYMAAPLSTFDPALTKGGAIPIEERPPEEVLMPGGLQKAPAGVAAWNPAFDITPAELITAIITDRGVLRPPYDRAIAGILGNPAGGKHE